MVGPISSSPACCNVTLITVLSTACGGIGLVYRLSDGRRVGQTKERVCGSGAATVYSLEACELHLSWLLHCVLVPPGPGPGNTHNWKLDSYVDWLCERNQALVSWGWFRVWQEGENRECPVNKCITLNGLHQTSMSTSVNWSTWQFLHEMQVYNYTIHSLGGGGGILIHVFLSCIKCSWLKVHCWLCYPDIERWWY